MTQYNPKFAIGDTVHYPLQTKISVPTECKICNSTGEVNIEGETFKCPKCNGRKTVKFRWEYGGEFNVVKILISDDEYRNTTKYEYISNNYNYDDSNLYEEDYLFKTKEECMEYVAKYNKLNCQS